jgi:KH domain
MNISLCLIHKQVQITFPDSSEKSDVVKIRGPKQDVEAAFKHLQKLHKELLESSYSVKVKNDFTIMSPTS